MATANMLVINQPAEAVRDPGGKCLPASGPPVEVALVRSVLDGDRKDFGRLYDL